MRKEIPRRGMKMMYEFWKMRDGFSKIFDVNCII